MNLRNTFQIVKRDNFVPHMTSTTEISVERRNEGSRRKKLEKENNGR